ncbi:MAG TPA: hypothetical protein VH143_14980 [Kofleriaceae bacterium]|nr:hypothetical protein [Kofleriaceae bacterium]
MKRCESTTATGKRCLNYASDGSRFCGMHSARLDTKRTVWVAGGTVLGHALLPGFGGAIGGALTGLVVNKLRLEAQMGKKRVFVSFDFDNDRALKTFIIGQAELPDSPFAVVDCSLKEAAPMKTWEEKARKAIESADLVIVMVGPQTYRASGVLKEVRMARAAAIKLVQVIGYKDGDYTPVPDAGRLYAWNWPNLKKLLA